MKPSEIYSELARKSLNATILADALGVLPQTVGLVIRQGKGSKRIAQAIAIAIDQSLFDVFPYYAPELSKDAIKKRLSQELKEKLQKAM